MLAAGRKIFSQEHHNSILVLSHCPEHCPESLGAEVLKGEGSWDAGYLCCRGRSALTVPFGQRKASPDSSWAHRLAASPSSSIAGCDPGGTPLVLVNKVLLPSVLPCSGRSSQ